MVGLSERINAMLGFLFGLGIGSMLLHSDSSISGNKKQVEAFRFVQLSSLYYEAVKKYVKYNNDKNKSIWWTEVKGRTLFIFLYENTLKVFYPHSDFLSLSYYLEEIGKEYKKEYKITDGKLILLFDDEIIEFNMNYMKGSNSKLILSNIDDDNDKMLVKRIVID